MDMNIKSYNLCGLVPWWLTYYVFLKVSGGDSEEATPVPISNTVVKLFSADGTAWGTAWESRTSPGFITKKPLEP